MQQIYVLSGQGMPVREIARTLGLSRNSVRKYLRSPGAPVAKVRAPRPSLLDPYKDYVRVRLADGLENCEVLLRELRARGYTGKISILKDAVQPFRQRLAVVATERYETEPGEQAQIDFGLFRYERPDGTTQQVYGFVVVLSWSRALYVEFVRRADLPTFLGCHVRAFEALGGMAKTCLYDNTKLVVLTRDEAGQPMFTPGFLDFSLRVGFEPRLCQPYRPQTKGRVESGIEYVRGNFWPGARFTDDADLNEQARAWVGGRRGQPADPRHHPRAAGHSAGGRAASVASAARAESAGAVPERDADGRAGRVRPVGAWLVRGELEARRADRRGPGRCRDGPVLDGIGAAGGPPQSNPARAAPDDARPVGRAADGGSATAP